MASDEKTITMKEAFDMYLNNNWDSVMPFDNAIEPTFVRHLEQKGYNVVKESEVTNG